MSGTTIPRDTTNPTLDSLKGQIASFKKTWNKKMDDLNKEITHLKKKLRKASTKNKKELHEKLNDLEAKRKGLQSEIDSAGNNSAAQWNVFTKK